MQGILGGPSFAAGLKHTEQKVWVRTLPRGFLVKLDGSLCKHHLQPKSALHTPVSNGSTAQRWAPCINLEAGKPGTL